MAKAWHRGYDVCMKKPLLLIGALVLGLVVVMVLRANIVFEDVQLPPAEDNGLAYLKFPIGIFN